MAKKTNAIVHGKKKYRVRLNIGTDKYGGALYKNFYGDSKREADDKKATYLDSMKNGSAFYDDITFRAFYYRWLVEIKKPALARSSYNQMKTKWHVHIESSHLAGLKLSDIKSLDVQRFINNLPTADLAKRIYVMIKSFFKYCIKERLINFNPCDNIALPKNNMIDNKKKYLTQEDINILSDAFKKDNNLFIFIFALMTGLRQGEILGLTHHDIHLNLKSITVNKSLSREYDDNGHVVIATKTTKNKSSVRQAPIPDVLIKPIKTHIKKEKEKHLLKQVPFAQDCLFFTNSICRPLRRDKLTAKWHDVQYALGIDGITFHGLRHTFCTLLALNDVQLKVASTLMGHADIQTTAKIYTHINQSQKQSAIQKLNGIL